MCVKGAPERLLPRAPKMLTAQGERTMRPRTARPSRTRRPHMAQEALRVLGLAYRRLPEVPDLESDEADPELVWVGLVGMIDPPRPEARQAVEQCRQAGIRVIMVTGDHPVTASAVAREVGLIPPGQESHAVITGPELNQLSDPELKEALREVRVFARVAPEHKLRLVDILKAQGEVVAMTGDGVNDAPALKRADIGVAMGITGTEVTKETAAMILADDNFATLVAAVEEGRAIFDNIKKYLVFLLSCNLAEILVLTGAFFLGLPLPLIALQILWVNLTTDGLPALALGVDPKAPDIMSRPPRPPAEGVFSPTVNALLAAIALYLTVILIPLFGYYYYWNPWGLSDPEMVLTEAQTMVFITLVLAELVNAFNCRSDYLSLFKVGVFGNRFLILSVLASLAMMVMVIEWEPAVPSLPHHPPQVAGLAAGGGPQPHPGPRRGADQVDYRQAGPAPAAGGPGGLRRCRVGALNALTMAAARGPHLARHSRDRGLVNYRYDKERAIKKAARRPPLDWLLRLT